MMESLQLTPALDAPDFVVHNYSDQESTQPPSLLYSAYGLICAAISRSPWLGVGNVHPSTSLPTSTRIVQYPPPDTQIFMIPTGAYSNIKIYKDWGAPLGDDDDIFTLNRLEDFQSTDLSFLIDVRPVAHAIDSGPTPVEPPLRSQYTFDRRSLLDVISQPHVHPSSAVAQSRRLKMVPYRKTRPIPIPPYTSPFSPSPYSRCAWLIPIRGSFPWDQCTHAIMFDSSHTVPASSDPKNGDPIAWTHSSIRSFWSFLLDIKEKQTAGTIGVSFHASRIDTQISQVINTTPSTIPGQGNQQTLGSPLTFDAGTIASSVSAPHALLSSVDHIKVYHEASDAMHLRNIFHLWSYAGSPATESHAFEKIRVLKGARLALVDERSRGILIS